MEKSYAKLLLNATVIPVYKFPNGELRVNVPSEAIRKSLGNTITMLSYDSDSILALMFIVDAIRQQQPSAELDLYMPYLMYSRQDRLCNDGESFTLKVFANLINSLNFTVVRVQDAHSGVGPALIDRCVSVEPANMAYNPKFIQWIDLVKQAYPDAALNVVAPDAGASKKVFKFAATLAQNVDYPINFVQANKIRNVSDGHIVRTTVDFQPDPDKIYINLVMDDICDGGATFIELSKKLTGINMLYITHGFFTRGIAHLLDSYATIGCGFNWGNAPTVINFSE